VVNRALFEEQKLKGDIKIMSGLDKGYFRRQEPALDNGKQFEKVRFQRYAEICKQTKKRNFIKVLPVRNEKSMYIRDNT